MDSRPQYTIHPAGQQVLQIIAETASYHGKKYCFPNQRTIARSLLIRFGRVMSRRTLCRWTAYLEAGGWIAKQSRHRREKDGRLGLHSTLYVLKRRSLRFLGSVLRGLRQVLDIPAVTRLAQSTNTKGVSQPTAREETRTPTARAAREGIEAMRRALHR